MIPHCLDPHHLPLRALSITKEGSQAKIILRAVKLEEEKDSEIGVVISFSLTDGEP